MSNIKLLLYSNRFMNIKKEKGICNGIWDEEKDVPGLNTKAVACKERPCFISIRSCHYEGIILPRQQLDYLQLYRPIKLQCVYNVISRYHQHYIDARFRPALHKHQQCDEMSSLMTLLCSISVFWNMRSCVIIPNPVIPNTSG